MAHIIHLFHLFPALDNWQYWVLGAPYFHFGIGVVALAVLVLAICIYRRQGKILRKLDDLSGKLDQK